MPIMLNMPGWMAQTPIVRVGQTFPYDDGATIDTPAGTQNGDFMVAVGYSGVTTTPAGWTQIAAGSSGVQSMRVWYRVASSEGATLSLNGVICGAATYRNVTGVDVNSAFAWVEQDTVDPSSIDIPSMTITRPGKTLAFVGHNLYNFSSKRITTLPSEFTQIGVASEAASTKRAAYFFESTRGPGATGNKTFAVNNTAGTEPRMGGVMLHLYQ